MKVPNIQSFVNQKGARTRQNFQYKKYNTNIKLQLSCLPNSKFSTKIERIIELKMDNYKTLTETQSASLKPNVQSTIDLKLLRISPSAQYKTCRKLCQLHFLFWKISEHSSIFERVLGLKSARPCSISARCSVVRAFAPRGSSTPTRRHITGHHRLRSATCPWNIPPLALRALEPACRRLSPVLEPRAHA